MTSQVYLYNPQTKLLLLILQGLKSVSDTDWTELMETAALSPDALYYGMDTFSRTGKVYMSNSSISITQAS